MTKSFNIASASSIFCFIYIFTKVIIVSMICNVWWIFIIFIIRWLCSMIRYIIIIISFSDVSARQCRRSNITVQSSALQEVLQHTHTSIFN
jgi:hypothetical protein